MAFEKKVSIAIIGKTDDFVKSLTKGQKALSGFGNVAGAIGKATVAGLGLVTAAAVTVGKDMVELASNAKEAEAAFEATFGQAIPEFGNFIEDFSAKAGLATFELKDLLKTSGSVLQGIDFTAEASANLSQQLATVAGDVAAFNNVQGGTQPVLEAMTKALLGERESLKTYGIAISEAEVQAQAFANTGKSVASELTKQEKAQATLELITKKSAVTQGYMNAEQDSFATKSKQAQAKIKELQATLGAELLPIVEELLPVIIAMVTEVGPHLTEAIKAVSPFISAIGQMIAQLAPPIIAIVSLLLTALAPAFAKLTEVVEKYLAPFLTNLPKNFENMINRIIDGLNFFIGKLNSFAETASRVLSKIGINIDIPKIKEFGRVSLGFAQEEVKKLTPDEIDTQRMATGMLATSQAQAQNITNNYNVNVSGGGNPDEVARKTAEVIKNFTDKNGTLGRVGIQSGGGAGIVIV